MKKLIITTIIILISIAYGLCQEYDTLVDKRDGTKYKIVKIGEQWWMAENLYYKTDTGSFCFYRCYYTWNTAQNVCPDGWHLPSDAEWKTLENYLGMEDADLDKEFGRYSGFVGKKLKPDGSSGFNGEMTGYAFEDGSTTLTFVYSYFWCKDEFDENEAWYRALDRDSYGIIRSKREKSTGHVVRCLKD